MIESKYLQDNIKNIQQLLAIPALKNWETQNLGKLLRLSKVRHYTDGECIIREGDVDYWLYFLLSGQVRIAKAGVDICRLTRVGDIFGEMRILDSLSRSASVFAVGPTVCLAVDTAARARLRSADEAADFLFLLYRVFAEYISIRLRLANEELIKTKRLLEQLKDQPR